MPWPPLLYNYLTSNVSFELPIAVYACVYNMEGQRVNKAYDGTVEMASREYLPYLLLAIFMLIAFNILPLALLTFYPFQCF